MGRRELYQEVGKRHVLYGIKARVVGRRQDCDDTLFELIDGSGRFAVVHLAYGHHPEPEAEYPVTTEIYGSWLEFEVERMKSDAAEWGRGERSE